MAGSAGQRPAWRSGELREGAPLSESEIGAIAFRTRYKPGEEAEAGDSGPQAAADRFHLLRHIAWLESAIEDRRERERAADQ